MEQDIKKMTDDEFNDWAAGHILQSLIKGNFKMGVIWALQCFSVWQEADRARLEAQAKKFKEAEAAKKVAAKKSKPKNKRKPKMVLSRG